MARFEILEHKADLKIRAFGKTKEELFLSMLKGMAGGLRPKIKNHLIAKQLPTVHTRQGAKRLVRKAKIKNIKIKSLDLAALLVDFLSEVLYLTQVNREVYNGVKFNKFSDTKLEAELLGQKVERFDEDIKAVTYHQLDIRQRRDGIWEATVLFDI